MIMRESNSRSEGLARIVLVALGSTLFACSANDDARHSSNAAGGTESTGGQSASDAGGASSAAGSSASKHTGGSGDAGGASNGGSNAPNGGASTGNSTSGNTTGGSTGSGGTSAVSGGAGGTGGTGTTSRATGTGGFTALGGAVAFGGNRPTGGASLTGGTRATGGMSGTGGLKPTGGSTATSVGTTLGGAGGSSSTGCPYTGHISYTLATNSKPTAEEQNAYALIKTAMDKAVTYYNCYTNLSKSLNISYVPSVSTADGNINGSIRFGSNTTYMDYRTAMHEISHTVGIGTSSKWLSCVDTTDKLYTCANGKQQLVTINSQVSKPVDSALHADTQHFWPYGINQQSEVKSEADLIYHCQMVMAMLKDLG